MQWYCITQYCTVPVLHHTVLYSAGTASYSTVQCWYSIVQYCTSLYGTALHSTALCTDIMYQYCLGQFHHTVGLGIICSTVSYCTTWCHLIAVQYHSFYYGSMLYRHTKPINAEHTNSNPYCHPCSIIYNTRNADSQYSSPHPTAPTVRAYPVTLLH